MSKTIRLSDADITSLRELGRLASLILSKVDGDAKEGVNSPSKVSQLEGKSKTQLKNHFKKLIK